MLMRFDPFQELGLLSEQAREGRRARALPMDAYRTEDELRIDMDLPGVDPDAIDITVDRNVLTVKAERQPEADDAEVLVAERPQGTFSRDLLLGDNLDAGGIRADYRDGVLHLTIPVAEPAKARRIEVRASPGAKAIDATST